QDKAHALLGGDYTVIEAVYSSVKSACSTWTIVADEEDKFVDLELATIVDDKLYQGPLGGIWRAAKEVEDGYFVVVSCDRIGLRASWVDRLKEALKKAPDALAAAFFYQDRWEPLFGIYHASLLDQIET